MQHCSRNNGVCSGFLSPTTRFTFSFHFTHPKSRDSPSSSPLDHPPMREANALLMAFLSLWPRQIMIALISFNSRLSVLPRDIVTRQHEGQDNSQKSLSRPSERMKIDVGMEVTLTLRYICRCNQHVKEHYNWLHWNLISQVVYVHLKSSSYVS